MRYFFKDFLEPLSYLIYVISFLIILKKNKSILRGFLFIYYLFATLTLFVAIFSNVNNWIYNIFFFVTVCVFSYYFHTIISNTWKKLVITISLGINFIIFFLYNVVLHRLHHYNTHAFAVNFLSIVVYAIFYFFELIRNIDETVLLDKFDFWFVSASILYFIGSFSIICFYEQISVDQRALLWSLQNIVLFLSSLITLTGSVWIPSQKKS